jgi:hypothetical protein
VGFAHEFAKVIDDLAVEPNRDPNLLRRQRKDRPAFSLVEVGRGGRRSDLPAAA